MQDAAQGLHSINQCPCAGISQERQAYWLWQQFGERLHNIRDQYQNRLGTRPSSAPSSSHKSQVFPGRGPLPWSCSLVVIDAVDLLFFFADEPAEHGVQQQWRKQENQCKGDVAGCRLQTTRKTWKREGPDLQLPTPDSRLSTAYRPGPPPWTLLGVDVVLLPL